MCISYINDIGPLFSQILNILSMSTENCYIFMMYTLRNKNLKMTMTNSVIMRNMDVCLNTSMLLCLQLCQFNKNPAEVVNEYDKVDHTDISSFNDDMIRSFDNENEVEVEPTVKCTFMSVETVYHANDDIRTCSQCQFETKCEAAYDGHWARTPGHIFPSEKLITMTFSYD